jgi:hypothetical protein
MTPSVAIPIVPDVLPPAGSIVEPAEPPGVDKTDFEPCPVCWGFGAGDDGDPCPRCHGTGCA